MPTPKVVQLVTSCGGCPNKGYYSGGASQCKLTEEIIQDMSSIAPFCPLADFPSKKLADMEATIGLLRDPNKRSLSMAILAYVAARLKTTVSASGAVEIKLKKGESVYLIFSHLLEITSQPWSIIFMYGDKKYRLYPEREPSLSVAVKLEGSEGEGWQTCQLE